MTHIQKVVKPELPPAICFRCRAGYLFNDYGRLVREYFIDTNISYDWEGRIYICNYCVQDFINECPDLIIQSKAFQAVDQMVRELLDQNDDMKKIIEYVESIGISLDHIRTTLMKAEEDGRVSDGDVGSSDDDSGTATSPDESNAQGTLAFSAPSLAGDSDTGTA